MSKTIELNKGNHLYMSDYNRLINANILTTFLENATDQKIEIAEIPITKRLLQKRIKDLMMLTLEVTEQCNLRCKYCVFNENYDNQRKLTSRMMEWEIAQKGIEYAYSLIKDREEKKFAISFYGGEPLLNFELISRVVRYSRDIFQGWALNFNLTTNLTLLDDTILQFLIENEIRLAVSLDGDMSNHDAKRVFRNGTGTHTTVMKNLEKIRKTNKEYYEGKVTFLAVYSYDLPFENVCEFFGSNNLVSGKSLRLSNVTPYNTDYYKRFPWDKNEKKESFTNFNNIVLEKMRNAKKLTSIESYFSSKINFSADFLQFREYATYAQTCLFDSRLFIDVNGHFHACEKMNNSLSYGNVDTGLDYSKMIQVLNKFTSLIKSNCMDCEIRFICSRCFAPFAVNGDFKIPEGFCEKAKKTSLDELEKYIQLKEYGQNTQYRDASKIKIPKVQTVKKFHQFINVERGPVNSAIIDLLCGNVFHVPNEAIDKFNASNLDDIQEFVQVLQEEKMILNIEHFRWIPEINIESSKDEKNDGDQNIELHIEEGADLSKIISCFAEYPVYKVVFYGTNLPAFFKNDARIEKREKNFNECIEQASIDGSFCKIQESMVRFNKRFNSCWGGTIAITADGIIRPCIHSHIKIGTIERDLYDIESLIGKMEPYWAYNKDKVERCCDCEFRYVCFDCREIAMRRNGEISNSNPLCGYNPHSGDWEDCFKNKY
jgi:uncharacterized protein